MNNQEMNLAFVRTLDEWDPFQLGEGNYDTEIADCIQAVHDLEDNKELAVKIRAIYEFSFEQWIPMADCEKMAERLLEIKNSGACSI